MAMWNTVLALLLYLIYVDPSCSGVSHGRSLSFSSSLRLTRSVQSSAKKLLHKYKIHLMGDQHFENRDQVLPSLPALSFNYSSWVLLKDSERLCWDAETIQVFLAHLETQRLRVADEVPMGIGGAHREQRAGRIQRDLSKSIDDIQADLENLLKHVNSQLRLLSGHSTGLGSPCGSRSRPERVTNSASAAATGRKSRSTWERREEGYLVLRDLKKFLNRLFLDLNFLKVKQEAQ